MITGISIRNFCGLTALEIAPGKVTVLSGKNGAGKSSVLKAIEAAFQAKGVPIGLIRRDADKAEVLVDLGDMQINRRITAAGNYLDVTRDDAKLNKPQAVLDDLIGPALVFSPVEFFLASAKEQREMLLQAVPISVGAKDLDEWFDRIFAVDCSAHGLEVLAKVEKLLFEERTGVNAVVKEHENTVAVVSERIPEGFDTAKWRAADVSDLASAIRDAQDARNHLAEVNDAIAAIEQGIALGQQRKAALEEQLAEVNDSLAVSAKNLSDGEAKRDAIEIPDDTEAQEALAEHSEAMAVLADVDALEGAQVKAAAASAEADELTDHITVARKKPAELLAAAELPIKGLEITADSIALNGIAVEQLSDSEQLLLGLEIAKALSGDFGIVCVDGAELLDNDNFQTLIEQARVDEHQYFVTRVGGSELEIADYDLEANDGSDA